MQNIKKTARWTGVGYLLIFFTSIFANFVVIENMVVKGNAAETFANISAGLGDFKMAFLSFMITVIVDAILAWTLYLILKPVNRELAMFSAWMRIIHAVLMGIGLNEMLKVAHLVGNGAMSGIDTEMASRMTLSYMESFNDLWLMGLVFFGLHLFTMGLLIYRSGYLPKFVSVLLIFAAAGYIIDSFAQFMLTDYESYADIFAMIVIIPGVVGELSLTIYLLVKGVNEKKLPNPVEQSSS